MAKCSSSILKTFYLNSQIVLGETICILWVNQTSSSTSNQHINGLFWIQQPSPYLIFARIRSKCTKRWHNSAGHNKTVDIALQICMCVFVLFCSFILGVGNEISFSVRFVSCQLTGSWCFLKRWFFWTFKLSPEK